MKVRVTKRAIQTWYLVQPKGSSRPWWFTTRDRRYWENALGGIRLRSEADKIISKVRCRFDDLDHSVTGLLVPDSKHGWLSPAGRFYGCTSWIATGPQSGQTCCASTGSGHTGYRAK